MNTHRLIVWKTNLVHRYFLVRTCESFLSDCPLAWSVWYQRRSIKFWQSLNIFTDSFWYILLYLERMNWLKRCLDLSLQKNRGIYKLFWNISTRTVEIMTTVTRNPCYGRNMKNTNRIIRHGSIERKSHKALHKVTEDFGFVKQAHFRSS